MRVNCWIKFQKYEVNKIKELFVMFLSIFFRVLHGNKERQKKSLDPKTEELRRGKNIKPDFLFQFLILSVILFSFHHTTHGKILHRCLLCSLGLSYSFGDFLLVSSHSFTVYFLCFFFLCNKRKSKKRNKTRNCCFYFSKATPLTI